MDMWRGNKLYHVNENANVRRVILKRTKHLPKNVLQCRTSNRGTKL